MINGGVSFWWQQIGAPEPRARSTATSTATSASSAAGSPGSGRPTPWAGPTRPRHRRAGGEFAGFGASGRNGGWLSAELLGQQDALRRDARPRRASCACAGDGREPSTRSSRSAGPRASTPTSSRTASCTSPARRPQLGRMREGLAADARLGHRRGAPARARPPTSVEQRLRVDGALGGTFSPHCARVHPAKLVGGLAAAVERRGVAHPRAHPVTEHRARRRCTTERGTRARADGPALPRGLHRRPPGPAPHLAADELAP